MEIGLAWEILASEVEVEEPEACSVTQAAMISKEVLCLLTHEMQAFLKLRSLASGAADAAFVSTDDGGNPRAARTHHAAVRGG